MLCSPGLGPQRALCASDGMPYRLYDVVCYWRDNIDFYVYTLTKVYFFTPNFSLGYYGSHTLCPTLKS